MEQSHAHTVADPQGQRNRTFLAFVMRHVVNPVSTAWGLYRCFDGYALAAYALGDTGLGDRLLLETLDMIDSNFAEEDADPKAK